MQVPFFQIRSNCIIYYSLPHIQPGRIYKPMVANLHTKSYRGTMSPGSIKRIRRSIDILIQKSPERIIYNSVSKQYIPFSINFITLTVSARKNINIRDGYENLMKPFLRKLRHTGAISYIWKAEFQKRGQLHYHLTTNRFIEWSLIRNTWNGLQRKHRYLDDYALTHRHFNANSTDVHAVYKINDLGAYLSKYMSKPVYEQQSLKNKNKPIIAKGKVWDCSKDLKKPFFSFTPSFAEELNIDALVDAGKVKIIKLDRCMIFKFNDPLQIVTNSTRASYDAWIQ